MECTSLGESSSPPESIHTIEWRYIIMGLIIACVGIGVRVKIFVRMCWVTS